MNNKDIVAAARKRLGEAEDADKDNRDLGLDDLENLIGVGQWDEASKAQRESEGRPCLIINRLPQFVRQVTGQIRSMNPGVKVKPADGVGSKEVAEVYEGLIRQIEYSSDAASIYEASGEQAAAGGFGAFRVMTRYVDDASFDQEIYLERIHNPFSVYFDPLARMSTRQDAEWCLITDVMTVEDFKATYPGRTTEDAPNDSNPQGFRWYSTEGVTVAEYFWKDYKKVTIWQLPDGSTTETKPEFAARSREVRKATVMWAKVSGADVLEGPQEFPCDYIPVVAVTGEEIHIGDEVYRSSVIRYAKDPQRLYNMSRSAHAEVVALQPKAPFLVTVDQVDGLETFWNQANSANRPYLPYNPDDKAGAPQRAAPPMPSAGLLQEVQLAAEDMKGTTGIYDAGLGNRSNETSGVAIDARKQESQNATSIYADNVVKAVAHAGRIMISMIPRVYDTQRAVQILGEDDQEKLVIINRLLMGPEGVQIENNLSVGKYAVRVGVGPTYSTRRQESADAMISFVQAV